MNVYEAFRLGFDKLVDRCFIDAPGHGAVTYGALDDVSARLAGVLRGLGLGKNDRLAVRAEKSPELILLWCACLRAGIVFVPLNARAPDAEVLRIVADLDASLLIADKSVVGCPSALRELALIGSGSLLARAAGIPADTRVESTSAQDIAMILYTSGSTGVPKGVTWSHGFMADNARAQQNQWALTPEDTMLHVVPMAHSHGYSVALNSVLLGGAKLRLLPGFDAEQVIDELAEASVFSGVPTMYARLLESPRLTAEACRNVRLFLSSSAAISPAHVDAFETRTRQRIVQCYGLTETGTLACSSETGHRKRGTVGRAWPHVQLRVVDDEARLHAPGACGHLEVRKAQMFGGYWHRPDETGACYTTDGYFRTGDLASIDDDGFLALVGRAKDVVVTGGYNVYPREVELACERVPGVKESAVVGVPHPLMGEVPVAFVVPHAGCDVDSDTVLDALRTDLAPYKLPRRITVVRDLPRLPAGKVDARRLREGSVGLFTQPTCPGRT